MMKSRRFSRSSVRTALNLAITASLLFGCSVSNEATYLQKDVAQAIKDICLKEYNTAAVTRLTGQTLWIYVPIEDMFEKAKKPEKFNEKFDIEENKSEFSNNSFLISYKIKSIPEKESLQEYKYAKKASDKINNVWKTIRRVIFSMEKSKKGGPQFFCIVIADIKNAYETKEIFYIEDLKKVSYELISWNEYQHRSIQLSDMSPAITGDKEGAHLEYTEITFPDFIALQIQHRIKLKFQKPEVSQKADIDKEILQIALNTIRIYVLKDFNTIEILNEINKNKVSLNRAAVFEKPTE